MSGLRFDWDPGGLEFVEERAALAHIFTPGLAKRIAGVIRRGGQGSVSDQFRRVSSIGFSGTQGWTRTKAFGTRPKPRLTLQPSPANYRSAWTTEGAPGAITNSGGSFVEVGVDEAMFPQVKVFQGGAPAIIRAKTRSKSGKDWAMRLFLGWKYGVWMRKSTVESGILVAQRPVRLNAPIMDRIGREVLASLFARRLLNAEKFFGDGPIA